MSKFFNFIFLILNSIECKEELTEDKYTQTYFNYFLAFGVIFAFVIFSYFIDDLFERSRNSKVIRLKEKIFNFNDSDAIISRIREVKIFINSLLISKEDIKFNLENRNVDSIQILFERCDSQLKEIDTIQSIIKRYPSAFIQERQFLEMAKAKIFEFKEICENLNILEK